MPPDTSAANNWKKYIVLFIILIAQSFVFLGMVDYAPSRSGGGLPFSDAKSPEIIANSEEVIVRINDSVSTRMTVERYRRIKKLEKQGIGYTVEPYTHVIPNGNPIGLPISTWVFLVTLTLAMTGIVAFCPNFSLKGRLNMPQNLPPALLCCFVFSSSFTLAPYLQYYTWVDVGVTNYIAGTTPDTSLPPDFPLIFYSYLIGQLFLISIIVNVFRSPLIPDGVYRHPDRFISNQWRFAQVTISGGLAAVVGLSIPFVFRFTEFGLLPLIFALSSFIIPTSTVLLFLLYRIHRVEYELRTC